MSAKHRLKSALRTGYARLLYHTGLHRALDRLMPPRLTILFGHCVDDPSTSALLAAEMKIRGEKLEAILSWLGRRYELVTIAQGWKAVGAGKARRSLVALSMDDGYRDNLVALLPLLARLGAKATVFLESRPLDERRLNWTHKFFWVLDRASPAQFAARFAELGGDPGARAKLAAAASSSKPVYQLKRALKYEVDPLERERLVDALFLERGGDERALCERLYLSWDDARRLRDAGVELGCHTVSHAILACLDAQGQQAEIEGCARALERELGSAGETLAYPFGRRWDYDERSVAAARSAGYGCAVNTHAGVNTRGSDPYQLRRIAIDDASELHVIAAEACGGFELLRKIGLDLSE